MWAFFARSSSQFSRARLLKPLSASAGLIPKLSPLLSASKVTSRFNPRPRSNVRSSLGLALGGVTMCALASTLKNEETGELKKDIYFERYHQEHSVQSKTASNGQLLSPNDPRPTPVTIITAINVLVFVAWRLAPPEFMNTHFTLSAANLFTKRLSAAHTLITSTFSHINIFHLGLNTFALFSIAPVLIQAMGDKDFWLVYLGCGLAASGASVAGSSLRAAVTKSVAPLVVPSIGASGSVFGLFSIFAGLYPESRFLFFFFPFYDFSANTMMKGVVTFDTLGLLYSCFRRSPLDHASHLGGVFSGIWAFKYLEQNNPGFRLRAARARNISSNRP